MTRLCLTRCWLATCLAAVLPSGSPVAQEKRQPPACKISFVRIAPVTKEKKDIASNVILEDEYAKVCDEAVDGLDAKCENACKLHKKRSVDPPIVCKANPVEATINEFVESRDAKKVRTPGQPNQFTYTITCTASASCTCDP